MYYLDGDGGDTRFRNAFIAAMAVHAAVALGVSFTATTTHEYTPQIEVTLATDPSAFVPVEADRLAQANQLGSGEESPLDRISSPTDLPTDAPAEQQLREQASTRQQESEQDVISTTGLSRPLASEDEEEAERAASHHEGVSPEFERISREIAYLQAELDQESNISADQHRVRRLDASTAKQSVDAAYLLDWRKRLEAVGNQYYPQASVRYGLYGDLRMLVVIRSDGSLEDIKVLSSSGYAVLDEAAIKIVRMAAPYSPFPEELKATTDKLEIVRTWHFQENPLSSP
jgi:protein TonB